MNFSIQSRKIGFFNAEASFSGHSSYILLFKNNDNYSRLTGFDALLIDRVVYYKLLVVL